MNRRLRIELSSRNDFWRNAFFVEWSHQFPARSLEEVSAGHYLAEPDWLPDLERVATQCFSQVRPAPQDPGRRQIFRNLFSSGRSGRN